MNPQVRRLFVVTLGMFAVLAVALTLVQFVFAPELVADQRNGRRYLQAADRDRGPIIVAGAPVALSERVEGTSQFQRVYPDGSLYSAVTGYFSAVGLSATGIERAENATLEGESSQMLWQRVRDMFAGKSRRGGGVVLTLDPEIQKAAAQGLEGQVGGAVALDVKTGAVLALYSSPSFNPNPLASLDPDVAQAAVAALEADPSSPLDNKAIAGNRYSPGSTFKILTSVAMIESGIKPDTLVDSPPTAQLPGTDVSVPNDGGADCGSGLVTLTEAFARSCNTTFILASQDLAPGALDDVATRFGFGHTFEIPLTVTPSVFPKDADPAQLALSSIGQFDVQATPFQMAMVAAAIGNGGKLMTPYLVDSIVDADNAEVSKTTPTLWGTPVTKEVADEVASMMREVVKMPYGSVIAPTGGTAAAKTGTAEIGDTGRTTGWTVAFAPADDPQIAVAVAVQGADDNPAPYGYEYAAPIVRAMFEAGLR